MDASALSSMYSIRILDEEWTRSTFDQHDPVGYLPDAIVDTLAKENQSIGQFHQHFVELAQSSQLFQAFHECIQARVGRCRFDQTNFMSRWGHGFRPAIENKSGRRRTACRASLNGRRERSRVLRTDNTHFDRFVVG